MTTLHDEWRRNGWVLLPAVFDAAGVQTVNDLVDHLWRTKPGDVTVDDVDRAMRTRMSRLDARDREHRIKISDLYLLYESVRSVLLAPALVEFLAEAFGDEPVLCNSLNMERGSGQEYHADSLFMTPLSPGGVAATWVALEEVRPGAGPLRVYSGSHLIPPFRFSNGQLHVIEAELPAWAAYMQGELDARGLTPEPIYARRGDVVIWHADLVHGAEPIGANSPSRRSLVGHYYPLRDALRRGHVLEGESGARWVRRRAQPVDLRTRVLCAVERRAQRLQGIVRAAVGGLTCRGV